MNPCLTDIELLREIFLEEKRPHWRLLAGRSTSGAKLAENFESDDLEASCELLIRRIEQYGAGTFNVVTFEPGKAATANSRGLQHPIKIGGELAGTSNSGSSTSFFMQFQQVLQFWELMNNRSSNDTDAAVAGAIADFQKDLEIQRLKWELQESRRPITKGQVIEKIMDRLPAIADRVFPGAGIAGTLGYDDGPDNQQSNQDSEESDQEEGAAFSIDRLFNTALAQEEQLQKMGVAYGANELYDRILKFSKSKPDQAKMLLNQL